MEAVDEITGGDQGGHTLLDLNHGGRVFPWDLVTINRQQSTYLAGRQGFSRSLCQPRHLIAAAPARPFCDNASGPGKALMAETPPELGPVAAAIAPICIQCREMGFEGIAAGSEDVQSTAANDLAYRLSCQTELTDDFLDRHAVARQCEDRVPRFLAPLKSIPLPPFRAGQEQGIDGVRCRGLPDRTHMLADHVEDGGAGIFDKMPTVSDLNGLWRTFGRSLAIAGAAVASDKIDARIIPKPGGDSFALAVRQERYNAAPLKIANDASVSTPSTPRPIIDAHSAKHRRRPGGIASDSPQERILADRDGEPLREIMAWPAAENEAKSMNDALHSRRSSRGWSRDARIEPLDEYLPRAAWPCAAKAADLELDLDATAVSPADRSKTVGSGYGSASMRSHNGSSTFQVELSAG